MVALVSLSKFSVFRRQETPELTKSMKVKYEVSNFVQVELRPAPLMLS